MSRLFIAALVTALLVFAAVPALAEDVDHVRTHADHIDLEATDAGEPVVGEAVDAFDVLDEESTCDNPDELEVVTVDGLSSQIETPDLTLVDAEAKSFLVDLGAESAQGPSELTVDMAWDIPLNDFDLHVTGEETVVSENAQPFDASEESVTLPVTHCQVVEVVAYNFYALLSASSLSLTFAVGDVKEAPVVPPLEALAAP